MSRYRTFATDDLAVEVWVNHDENHNRYVVNSKSPWHNPAGNGTSYPDAYKAVCAAKDTFERLSMEVEKEHQRECRGCGRIMSEREAAEQRACNDCARH